MTDTDQWWEVDFEVPDYMLISLPRIELNELLAHTYETDWWTVFGFTEKPKYMELDYGGTYRVRRIRVCVREVVKPELFGHPLKYTARRAN